MDIAMIFAGFMVGGIVGLSGVGGGAVMTPFLIFYGIPPTVAVGTDLIYAAITKTGAAWLYHKARTINWRIVLFLMFGSIPATLLAIVMLNVLRAKGINYTGLITTVLGIALIVSSILLLFKGRLGAIAKRNIWTRSRGFLRRWSILFTIIAGVLLGFLVTLSSVGAGALGAAILVTLYPRLRTVSVVGTDLAHAVPLVALAGVGHWHLGSVDFKLLIPLLLGSLPGVYLGARLATRLPDILVRRVLGCVLLAIGIKFAFF